MKRPIKQHEIICLYCGIENATWAMELDSGEIKMTVPLCNSCSLMPEFLLVEQLMPKSKYRSRKLD